MIKSLREWQIAAYPRIMKAWQEQIHSLVRAATGSGKSVLIGLVCRDLQMNPKEKIVITAPSVGLVIQLQESLWKNLGVSAGLFYEKERDVRKKVIIACHGSLDALTEALQKRGLYIRVWISDECHKTEAPKIKEFAEEHPYAWRLGFTATPHRAAFSGRLTLFDQIAYEYTPQMAFQDGVIVPPVLIPYYGSKTSLDDVCIDAISNPKLRGLQGLVSAYSIDDAVSFSRKLNAAGIRSAAIYGKQSRETQKKLIEGLRIGKLDCLVHVNLLTEGADLPWLRWLCMRRAAKNVSRSRNRFIQEVGRVLRTDPESGKTCAYILDPLDLFNRLKLSYDALVGQEIEIEVGDDEDEEIEIERDNWSPPTPPSEKEVHRHLRYKQPLRALSLSLRFQGIESGESPHLRGAMGTKEQKQRIQHLLYQVRGTQKKVPKEFFDQISSYAQGWLADQLNAGDLDDLEVILKALALGWLPE